MKKAPNRSRQRLGVVVVFLLAGCLAGCGVVIDAAELIAPIPAPSDSVDVVCRHRQLQVGISV